MTISEIQPGKPLGLAALVDYTPGSIVSRVLHRGGSGSITLFAFDSGQDVGEHTTACDAYALVLDGHADVSVASARAPRQARSSCCRQACLIRFAPRTDSNYC